MLAKEIMANNIAIMLIMSVIKRAHPFPFNRPHDTTKLDIPKVTNIRPIIVTTNPIILVWVLESRLINEPKNKGASPVKRRITPPIIIRMAIMVIPFGRVSVTVQGSGH